MLKFNQYLNESVREKTLDTEHGTVTIRDHLPGKMWRVLHPEAPNHFVHISKIKKGTYNVHVRKMNGDEEYRQPGELVSTKKDAIDTGAYWLHRFFNKNGKQDYNKKGEPY
jgi:hypothetical protein